MEGRFDGERKTFAGLRYGRITENICKLITFHEKCIIWYIIEIRLSCKRSQSLKSSWKLLWSTGNYVFLWDKWTVIKQLNILPQNVTKSQSCKIWVSNCLITLKFDRYLSSIVAALPGKFQSNHRIFYTQSHGFKAKWDLLIGCLITLWLRFYIWSKWTTFDHD